MLKVSSFNLSVTVSNIKRPCLKSVKDNSRIHVKINKKDVSAETSFFDYARGKPFFRAISALLMATFSFQSMYFFLKFFFIISSNFR